VIVPAYSCVALMNAVLALGAAPILADVDPERGTLDPDDVRRRVGRRSRAVVAVHLFGLSAPVAELAALGPPVIEDCAHGAGGRVGAGPQGGAGSANFSSFYATKLVAGGEGGIVGTRDPVVAERVREMREYADRDPNPTRLNSKLSDLAASVTRAQLTRLPEILTRREAVARAYIRDLERLREAGALELPPSEPGRVWYRFAVRLCVERAAPVVERLRRRGIGVEQPVWDCRGTPIWKNDCPGASSAFDRIISLPLYPHLGEIARRTVCHALEEVLNGS
jgi:dTDP-4-amino-4,6-dideoxygalactose transaminase